MIKQLKNIWYHTWPWLLAIVTVAVAVVTVMSQPADAQIFRRSFSSSGQWQQTSAGLQMPSCGCSRCASVRAQAAAIDSKVAPRPVAAVVQATTVQAVGAGKIEGTPCDGITAFYDLCDVGAFGFTLGASDVICDPGCGDGRVLIEGITRYGCRGIGVEIKPAIANLAIFRRRQARLSSRQLCLVVSDATEHEVLYQSATVAYMCLYPDVMARVIPRLPVGIPVVSYKFSCPGYRWRMVPSGKHVFWVLVR